MEQPTAPCAIVKLEQDCWLCAAPLERDVEHYIDDDLVCRACFQHARASSRKPRGMRARIVAFITGETPTIRLRRI